MSKINKKILINTSNLKVGGGLQVALSFLNEIKSLNYDFKYIVVLSPKISELINKSSFSEQFVFYTVSESPASLTNRNKVTRELDFIEFNEKPHLVFTIFGPSYWKPKAIHLMGVADGWLYNRKTLAHKSLDLKNWFRIELLRLYKLFCIKRDASYYIVETYSAKMKLCEQLKVDERNIFVVGNCVNQIFYERDYYEPCNNYYIPLPQRQNNEFRLIYVAHPYPHKNFKIIKKLIEYIPENVNIRFVVTLPEQYFKKFFNSYTYLKKIINLGEIPIYSCPSVYSQCDALFFPSLLETFSVSYLEAMKMGLPILTSDLDFAKEICGDAAIYFDPLSAKDALEKILYLYYDKEARFIYGKKASEKLSDFLTSKDRAVKYLEIMNILLFKFYK